jgi:hypothetical protein
MREGVVFDWLFEGHPRVYLILAGLAVVLVALWVRDRKGRWLVGAGVVFLLAGLYFLLDRLVETAPEQIQRKLQEMATGVKARDTGRIFNHISPQFRRGTLDRDKFRSRVDQVMRDQRVKSIEVWDFRFPTGGPRDGSKPVRVVFQVKAFGANPREEMLVRCEADFVRDPDGQWRLQTFQVFQPFVDSTQPLSIPYLD